MNKGQLIEMLSKTMGDKKSAAAAVDHMVDIIVRSVNKGENVTITGFGVFEKRARAARSARNPRTGEAVRIKKTNVPNFRPGTLFKEVISGERKMGRATAARPTAAARPAARPAAAKAAPKRATTTRSTTARSTTARSTTTRAAAAKKTAVKSTRPAAKKATTTKKAAAKTTRPTAKKATATKKATAGKRAKR